MAILIIETASNLAVKVNARLYPKPAFAARRHDIASLD